MSGGEVRDPQARRFVVKGAAVAYGTFAGGDAAGAGQRNFEQLPGHLDALRAHGANLVRVFVKAAVWDDEHVARLDEVVRQARARGLVVEISNSYSSFEFICPLRGRARAHEKER